VLAVGDAEFQKKCLGKMGDITAKDGRTVLFVSHNLAAISAISKKGIYLKNGLIHSIGEIQPTIEEYLLTDANIISYLNSFTNFKFDNTLFEPLEFGIVDNFQKETIGIMPNNFDIVIQFKFILKRKIKDFNFGFAIYDLNDQLLFWSLDSDVKNSNRVILDLGHNAIQVAIPKNFLNEGDYVIHLIASVHYQYWIFEPKMNSPKINLKIVGGLSESDLWITKRPGILAPILNYQKLK
jgi:lipopolysaccharide transport system ATP-binding protein